VDWRRAPSADSETKKISKMDDVRIGIADLPENGVATPNIDCERKLWALHQKTFRDVRGIVGLANWGSPDHCREAATVDRRAFVRGLPSRKLKPEPDQI
jgi:hypothetical protein